MLTPLFRVVAVETRRKFAMRKLLDALVVDLAAGKRNEKKVAMVVAGKRNIRLLKMNLKDLALVVAMDTGDTKNLKDLALVDVDVGTGK